ncbi:GGDEF domain-containing protein [Kineococcus sp. NUM-3379]
MSSTWQVPPLGSREARLLDARISGVMCLVGSTMALTVVDSPFVDVFGWSCVVLGVVTLLVARDLPAGVLSALTLPGVVGIANYAVNGQQTSTATGGAVLFVQLVLQLGLLRSRRETWVQLVVLLAVYAGFLLGAGADAAEVGQALGTVGLSLALLAHAVTWLRARLDFLLVELRLQATVDPLTGVLNRNGLARAGEAWRAEHGAAGQQAALLLLDVDHFKRVNDTAGHVAGDAVLARLGEVLRAGVPRGANVARLGGEEFLVVLPRARERQALFVAEELRVAASKAGGGDLPAFTVSVGVAAGHVVDDVDELYRRADGALYRAKANGRDRVELCTGGPVAAEGGAAGAEPVPVPA